jgi:hypothetical protein
VSATTVARTRRSGLERTSREALSALGVQFLLGMAANLIGSPAESAGAARIAAAVVLTLHALVGVGLLVVGVRVVRAARREGAGRAAAGWALAVTSLTVLSGVGTVLTDSAWLSFVMAAGFLAAAAIYVGTFVLGGRVGSVATDEHRA